MGNVLSERGKRIVRRGGADGQSDDDMLLLEIMAAAPGLSKDDLQKCFVALRMEYGMDARDALRTGHVKFEAVQRGAPTPQGGE